jgi:hypothetical protein
MRLLARPQSGWNALVMTGDDERALQMSGVIPPLFRASTQDDESVAQMVDLGSGTGTISRQRAGWFRRATQQMARWAGVAESDR